MKRYIIIIILSLCFSGLTTAQISGNVSLSQDEIQFRAVDQFSKIVWDNNFTEEAGNPELPVILKSYVLPYDAHVTGITINSSQKSKFPGEYYIFPFQPPIPTSEVLPDNFVSPNPIVYNSPLPYPNKQAEIIFDDYIQGYHVVTLRFYPVEYIPLEKELYRYNFSFTINYDLSNAPSLPVKQSLRRTNLAKSHIESIVENKQDIEQYTPNIQMGNVGTDLNRSVNTRSISIMETIVPDYIIITNEALKPEFQRLADWKTQKGVPTVIEMVENIAENYQGSDLTEKIRHYLEKENQKWGHSLFVLLGGDSDIVPPRIMKGYKDVLKPVDMYFIAKTFTWNPQSKVFTGSYGTSFYLGRAPVENIDEAKIFVDKVLAYEKLSLPVDLTYYNNILAIDAFLFGNTSGTLNTGAMPDIDKIFTDNLTSEVNKWYLFDHFNCKCGKHPTYDYDISHGEELNKVNFLSALNNGGNSGLNHFHIVYHMDHSSPKAMGASTTDKYQMITNPDADAITNGDYYQIIMSGGCEPADFSKDCIAERFLNNPNGGAVAFIGNSDNGWPGEWKQFKYFADVLYKHTHDRYDLGYAFQYSLNGTGNGDTRTRLQLLGDPEMPVWTTTPQNLNVTITPDVIINGNNSITVKVNTPLNGEKALICLMKGDEGYATLTVNDNLPHLFKFTPRTSGSVNVTVTAHNFRPFETTIPVKVNENSSVYIENLTFDDDKTGSSIGNGDKQLDAGETIEVTVDLKNSGKTTADSVFATLTCNSVDIQMIKTNVVFGDIPANGVKSSPVKFVFKINKKATENSKDDLNPVKFLLNISDKNHTDYNDDFNVAIFAPELEAANQEILSTTNGNKIIEPNETVTFSIDLMNYGKAVATGITGKLTSTSPYITDCSAVLRSYPNINKYETKRNVGTFQFKTTSSYVKGQALPFLLEVKNEFGKTWQLEIDPANRPVKPNSSLMSFTPFISEIDLFWTKATNASGYNIYKSESGINGNYVKLNTFPVQSPYYKDKGLAPYSFYYYKISAISEIGNEGELSNPFKTWTSCLSVELFPVSISTKVDMQGPINVADINNDGKMEIFTAARFNEPYKGAIIAQNYDGTDLFDIDGNPTEHNAFANVEGSLWGTPALGDLKAEGETLVVVGTRTTSSGVRQILCYSTKDKDGDHFPDLLWAKDTNGTFDRGSIIANLDNSSDGKQEVITFSCESQEGITIYDCDGNKLKNFGNYGSYGMPAVADLDGDGDKEIILGARTGLYIWHHDGRDFSTNPFYAKPDLSYWFCSSPVVCDIDNDGEKEILIAAKKDVGNNDAPSVARIYAFKPDGTFAAGWNETQEMPIPNPWYARDLSVGDINGDGNLEVVLLGTNMVRAWTNTGKVLFSKTISGLTPTRITPILADIDGDPDIEIVFGSDEGSNRAIYAINPDGSDVTGFPILTDDLLKSTLCVADIDNDGKNEILANMAYSMFAWKTEGHSDRIEWGCERHDAQNTGEYAPVCEPLLVTSDLLWSGGSPCGNIILESGKFTVGASTALMVNDNSMIIVKSGATLEVDGGSILNANIKALRGGKVILTNDGRIKLRSQSEFIIDKGAEFDYRSGSLE